MSFSSSSSADTDIVRERERERESSDNINNGGVYEMGWSLFGCCVGVVRWDNSEGTERPDLGN